MTPIIVIRTIAAPIDAVFTTVADIEHFSKAVPGITKVEFLSEVKSGLGTKFRETRLMKGKEAATELEVTEYVPNEKIRLVADSHGTVWDTVFTVKQESGGTNLTMVMQARAHAFFARIMNPMIRGMVAKAVEADMNAVKTYCEGQSKS